MRIRTRAPHWSQRVTSPVENQQTLRFHQALREKGIDGNFADSSHVSGFLSLVRGHAFKTRPNFRKTDPA